MSSPMSYGWRDRVVVVGTGPAGMAAADELRRIGFTGELTVLGDEVPYDRPACSKGVLSGHQKVIMDDGTELEFGPGDVVAIPPGHDGEVVGDEPCVVVDFAGMEHYAEQS